jgi:hypothetical protein
MVFGDGALAQLTVNKIVHFGPKDLVRNGLSHFGFHDRKGRHYAIFHQKHFLGLTGRKDELEWTLAADQILKGIPNIPANLNYPMYIDNLDDGSLVVRVRAYGLKLAGPYGEIETMGVFYLRLRKN